MRTKANLQRKIKPFNSSNMKIKLHFTLSAFGHLPSWGEGAVHCLGAHRGSVM